MPRLQPSLIRRAHRISPQLAALLPACRDLGSARIELCWIREHVLSSSSPSTSSSKTRNASSTTASQRAKIAHLCAERGRGIPLQYVLGSQPFGPLEIACRPGVLIPRSETEAWVHELAERIIFLLPGGQRHERPQQARPLRVVDFCTGTGCVAMLLAALLRTHITLPGPFKGLSIRGFDLETRAVALARRNLALNQGNMWPPRGGWTPDPGSTEDQWGLCDVKFEKADVFSQEWEAFLPRDAKREGGKTPRIDILVSNPPYISTRGFNHDTGRSVRNYEPKLALVPDPALLVTGPAGDEDYDCAPEDVFYARLLRIAEQTQAGVVLFEVGDMAQAMRVVALAWDIETAEDEGNGGWNHDEVEIWRDWPEGKPAKDEEESVCIDDVDVPVIGSGEGRAVLLRRGPWNR